jgi:NAD(P)H-flavin reductase
MAEGSQKFKLVATMTQEVAWVGEKRKVTSQFIKDYFLQPDQNFYFVTGTPRFVPAVFREIIGAGVNLKSITMEIFTGY